MKSEMNGAVPKMWAENMDGPFVDYSVEIRDLVIEPAVLLSVCFGSVRE